MMLPTTLPQTPPKPVLKTESPVRTVILVGGLTIIAFWAGKKVVKAIQGVPDRSQIRSSQVELNQLNKDYYTKQTLPQSQIESMANSIHTMMDGYGTEWLGIGQLLVNLRNNADYLALIKAYGIREVSSGTLNPEKNFKGGMTGAFRSEMTDWQIQWLNALLKKRGITYVI